MLLVRCQLGVAVQHLRATIFARPATRIIATARPAGCERRLVQKCQASNEHDWSALVQAEDDVPDEEDPDFIASFNEVCNQAVKVFMADDIQATLRFKDGLGQLGQFFAGQGKREAATFIYVLYNMLEHKLVKEMVELRGIYLAAFERIFNIIEDSGWMLTKEGEEEKEEEEELDPAALN